MKLVGLQDDLGGEPIPARVLRPHVYDTIVKLLGQKENRPDERENEKGPSTLFTPQYRGKTNDSSRNG